MQLSSRTARQSFVRSGRCGFYDTSPARTGETILALKSVSSKLRTVAHVCDSIRPNSTHVFFHDNMKCDANNYGVTSLYLRW